MVSIVWYLCWETVPLLETELSRVHRVRDAFVFWSWQLDGGSGWGEALLQAERTHTSIGWQINLRRQHCWKRPLQYVKSRNALFQAPTRIKKSNNSREQKATGMEQLCRRNHIVQCRHVAHYGKLAARTPFLGISNAPEITSSPKASGGRLLYV